MDAKFETVLARYHERMKREESVMKGDIADLMRRRDEVLLAVGPEVAHLLHDLIVGRGAKRILELGTSYGYSTLFLAQAAKETGGVVYTMDLAADKQAYARSQIADAGLGSQVEWLLGDATQMLKSLEGPFDFVLVDLWKDLYVPCLELFHPKLANNAIVVADNMIFPEIARRDAEAYRALIKAKGNVQSVLLPIGNGIEVSCVWNSSVDG